MQRCWKKAGSLLGALLLGWAVYGCVGVPSPATAPAPLAEIPSAIQFPDSIQVDTSEVGIDTGASTSVLQMAFDFIKNQVLPVGGQFFEAITLGFVINERTDLTVGGILTDLHQLQIPLNPITRTFEVSPILTGIFAGGKLKIDFADFDYLDSGTTFGCTGCTCPTGCDAACPSVAPISDLRPVCFRIWVDRTGTGQFTRLMAGFFEQLPFEDDPATPENEKNPGVGSYRVRFESSLAEGGPVTQIVNSGADFNHRDFSRPLDKSTEYYVAFILPFVGPANATMSHVKIEQQALDEAEAATEDRLVKTIRESVNQENFSDPNFDSTFQYIARYRTDANFWSGTLLNDLLFPDLAFAEPPVTPNFTAECAELRTGIGVDEGACLDRGIDVSTVPFLDLVGSKDPRMNLPEDFPDNPTF